MYVQAHFSEQRAARPNGFFQPIDEEPFSMKDVLFMCKVLT